MTSLVRVRAQMAPTASASLRSSGGTSTRSSLSSRCSRCWRGSARHTWARAPLGIAIAMRLRAARASRATTRRSPRSAAISALCRGSVRSSGPTTLASVELCVGPGVVLGRRFAMLSDQCVDVSLQSVAFSPCRHCLGDVGRDRSSSAFRHRALGLYDLLLGQRDRDFPGCHTIRHTYLRPRATPRAR